MTYEIRRIKVLARIVLCLLYMVESAIHRWGPDSYGPNSRLGEMPGDRCIREKVSEAEGGDFHCSSVSPKFICS